MSPREVAIRQPLLVDPCPAGVMVLTAALAHSVMLRRRAASSRPL